MKVCLLLISLFIAKSFLLADDEVKSDFAKKETVDFTGALEKAGAEDKPVLLLLLSKYCPECDLFKQKILSDEKFKAFTDHFVVKFVLEYPYEDPKQSEANLALGRIYTNLAFPSLVLLDENGLPADLFYFKDETVEAFIAVIELKIKRMNLKKQFLSAKDNSEKDKIVKEYFSNKVNGENKLYFADIIIYQSIEDKNLLKSERLKPYNEIKEKFHAAKSLAEKNKLAFEFASSKILEYNIIFFADIITFAARQKRSALADENMNILSRMYLKCEITTSNLDNLQSYIKHFAGCYCDDRSVQSAPHATSPQSPSTLKKILEVIKALELEDFKTICQDAKIGKPDRVFDLIKEKNISIEEVYSKNLCEGSQGSEYLLRHAQHEGNDKGNYFIMKFLKYLEEIEKSSGDTTLRYRLLNYSADTTRTPPQTLLDDVIGFNSSTGGDIIPVLIKNGAKQNKDLTDDDKKKIYEYPLTKKVNVAK